jgi:hypothetical protein
VVFIYAFLTLFACFMGKMLVELIPVPKPRPSRIGAWLWKHFGPPPAQ